jgi:hypothetical protein
MTRHKFSALKLSSPKMLGTAAILATALAASAGVSPAMAQQVVSNPGYCAQFYPNANCQNKGAGSPYTGDYQRRTNDGYRRGWNSESWNNDWNSDWRQSRNDDPVTWSGDVAAAAVGTAGAIATAPFRAADAYAYDSGSYEDQGAFGNGYARSDYYANAHAGQGWNGSYGNQNGSYAARNGFVCEPGTIFRGEDGLRHRCQ